MLPRAPDIKKKGIRKTHNLIKSSRTPTRNCNSTFPVTYFPVVDINTGSAHPLPLWQLELWRGDFIPGVWTSLAECQPIPPAELKPEQSVMWGVGVSSEVGVIIHPTGVLWDSGQDSGLDSPLLESYCPQTIPSQTLIYGREHRHANTDNCHHQTGLLP
jgi:hypothetical protein